MRGRTWERWGAISGLAALALATIANVPAAVLTAAVGVLAFRADTLPSWLGWLSIMVAAVHLVAWFGVAAGTGPRTPGEWVAFAVYPVFVV